MQKNNALPLCTVLYLLLPLLLFVHGWLRFPLSGILLVFLSILFLFVLGDLFLGAQDVTVRPLLLNPKDDTQFNSRGWIIAFLLLLLWVLLSGAGGFGYQNDDYRASNALLKDLIEQPWPITLQWNGVTAPVVYYVGWYLPAAFVGKLMGWSAGNIASLVWTFIGVSLSFLWFLRVASIKTLTTRKVLVALAIFCLADGLDFLMINTGWDFLQYSAQTTFLYWVPQHAVPAWLMMGLAVECIRGNLAMVKYLGISLAACLICSPFGVVGILPYLPILLVMNLREEQRRNLLSLQSVALNVGALPYALTGFLYLASNEFSFPTGFLWDFSDSPLIFLAWFVFCLVEFGVLSIVVLLGLGLDGSAYKRLHVSEGKTFQDYLKNIHGIDSISYVLFVTSVIFLLLLPLYRMGYNNDLVMRGSIPALFLFWAFISKLLADSGFKRNREVKLLHLVLICLAVIGFHLSLYQIFYSLTHYHFGAPDPNRILTTATVNSASIVEQRIGNRDTFFYRYVGK